MAIITEWREVVFTDPRMDSIHDIGVRSISDLMTEPKRLIDNIYFCGLDILRCYSGKFRFCFDDHEPVELSAGEVLIIYPRHRVTIDALEQSSRIVYGIFIGNDIELYFNKIGFFDLAKGKTSAHYESIMELKAQLSCSDSSPQHRAACLSFLTDILYSQSREMRASTNPLVFDAMKQIHENLQNGIVRLDPLCEQLKVSRSYLHRVFSTAGMPSPSQVIRQEQLRLAKMLLCHTRLTVSEIAEESGFISVPHFVTFIKKQTGQSPKFLRQTLYQQQCTAGFEG